MSEFTSGYLCSQMNPSGAGDPLHKTARLRILVSHQSNEGATGQVMVGNLDRELAECRAERDGATAQHAATSEILQVINSSPGDLAPVFITILDNALRLCEAAFGFVTTYDGVRFDRGAQRGVPDALAAYFSTGMDQPRPGDAHWRLLAGEELIHNLDQMDEEAYRLGNPLRRAVVDLGGARSALVVALRKDNALLGALTVYRKEVRPFSEKQIAILQNFAAHAVIAIENARLLSELRKRTEEIERWNRELETRVAVQVAEIERIGKLRRFLAPQLADLIVARGDESILDSHRREIVVVFCDVRGFTTFAERAEPEEVMALLRDFHSALGPIVARFEGTLDHYGGDGIMVFFNDPLPTPEPAKRAVEMAVVMRETSAGVAKAWRRHGHTIGFGVGIAQGYATLGQIGFSERMDYTAIGTVTNVAARLCGEAKNGQILVDQRVAAAVEDAAPLEDIGNLSLKGLSQPIAVYNVKE
jgi:class 3 adenylate cyclase